MTEPREEVPFPSAKTRPFGSRILLALPFAVTYPSPSFLLVSLTVNNLGNSSASFLNRHNHATFLSTLFESVFLVRGSLPVLSFNSFLSFLLSHLPFHFFPRLAVPQRFQIILLLFLSFLSVADRGTGQRNHFRGTQCADNPAASVYPRVVLPTALFVVYRGYVQRIAIRRTKARQDLVSLGFALLFRRHARDSGGPCTNGKQPPRSVDTVTFPFIDAIATRCWLCRDVSPNCSTPALY